MFIDLHKKNFYRAAELVGIVMILWMITTIFGSALAQVNTTDVLEPYRNFKPAEDMATRVMEGLLGPTYSAPLTSGMQVTTLFGAVFLVFNIVVFAVGTIWASYGVVSGIVQTAHEGVVLGKRMSAVWMPIRMVTGIGGLVPAFGGFSLSQVAMILATSWGISFANYAYDQAITASSNFATLVNTSFIKSDANKDGYSMAYSLFRQRICEKEFEAKQTSFRENGQSIPEANLIKEFPFSSLQGMSGTVLGRAVGTNSDPAKCYAVGLKRKTYLFGTVDQGGRWGSSALGFRSGAVDYKVIADQAWTGYASNFPEFVTRVQTIADKYFTAMSAKTGVKVLEPVDDIRTAGTWFAGSSMAAKVDTKAIKEDALRNMTKYGFFSAGSFYSTHAEVNAAVMQAADATDFVILAPTVTPEINSGDYATELRPPEEYVGAPTTSAGSAPKDYNFCLVGRNATGNCSFGQKLVSLMMDVGTAGAGGTSNIVDPIIALKNIGDYMMTLGEGLLAASVYKDSGVGSVATTAATTVLSAVPVVGSIVAPLIKALGAMLPYIGGLMFAVGALCAIYIPMVPFINWVSALVQYCCIVVEAFAAAPLWALAHLQADGEGMGQRTEKGYLYLLNLLFRPILMVAAFFAASALVILLGSVVMQMYLPAIAAAQGNSITGIFSAIGYVFLFFVILNIIIQGLFNLTMELADDAIGWVGGIGRSSIGRDTEGKVHNMFMMGGRFGAGGVDRAAGAAKAMSGAGGSGSSTLPNPSKPK